MANGAERETCHAARFLGYEGRLDLGVELQRQRLCRCGILDGMASMATMFKGAIGKTAPKGPGSLHAETRLGTWMRVLPIFDLGTPAGYSRIFYFGSGDDYWKSCKATRQPQLLTPDTRLSSSAQKSTSDDKFPSRRLRRRQLSRLSRGDRVARP